MSVNPNNNSTQRQCVSCKVVKPLDSNNYHKDKNRQFGFMYKCISCEKIRTGNQERHDRWKRMNPDAKNKIKAAHKRYSKTEKGMASSVLGAYKSFDKDRGYENNLTQLHVLNVRNSNCYYCGFAATGFDRKDNKKGHTIDNCIPCCLECNVARMDNFTTKEMEHLGESIRIIKAAREYNIHGICML